MLTLSLMLFATPALALALEKEPFTNERFEQLREEGQLVLVDVFADWCSTCARQQEILKAYVAEHPDVDLHILEVNYDNDKAIVRQLRAPRQSTLLLYKGDRQHWFSVAETNKDAVFTNLNRAANAQ
ncbi:MAG: thioredoxin [Halomonadaceae bacterium]|nr:MAG: thioredoxin [Halomonadaceae bacterium]